MFSSRQEGFKNWKLELKGQFTVVALVMVFIMLLMFAKFYPTMKTYIEELVPQVDELTGLIVELVPFLIAVAILMSVTWYIIPKRE